MTEDESGDTPRRSTAGCLGFAIAVAVLLIASLAGAIAFLVFIIRWADSWSDPFSPLFWWEYVRTPLGTTLTITHVAALLVVAALFATFWIRSGGRE